MRRFLIKLVGLETMLVGWLAYWIFLIYANNPSVSAGLGDQLSKFPQLAFTTVDIAVLVIIALFSIALAFKFHRGLRPGIRLERALQMLENLMKRNLVLEAQVAELRVEKVEKTPSRTLPSSPTISVPSSSGHGFAPSSSLEPSPGSWEKAFRTPLEAGPSLAKPASSKVSAVPFERETGIPQRIEPANSSTSQLSSPFASDKPLSPTPILETDKSEKPLDVPSARSGSWEDSPKYVGESTGILNPSPSPKKALRASESVGLKEPYIPVPAPRIPPPSVVVGPMTPKPPSPGRQSPRPIVRPSFAPKSQVKEPPSVLAVPEPKPAITPIIIDKPLELSPVESKPPENAASVLVGKEETKETKTDKPVEGYKKKPSTEED